MELQRAQIAIPKPEGSEPWLQQPNEPNNWYVKFLVFRDLGPGRTIMEVARVLAENNGKSIYSANAGSMYKAAKKFWWNERASAYDVHLDRIRLQEREHIARSIIKDQYEMVQRLTSLTLERIKTMDKSELRDAQDIIKAFDTAIKTGSLVIGLPTERTESKNVSFTINLSDKRLNDDSDEDNNIIDV